MFSKNIIGTLIATGLFLLAQQSYAAVVDLDDPNCRAEPDHGKMVQLAQEFGNTEKLEAYLQQAYGCQLTIDSDWMDKILLKYKYIQVITNTGNVHYEGLESCGYHPQREEFTCSMAIKQRFGFAGQPAIGPGSNEWVTICVDYGNGYELVDTASVHVHDEAVGQRPNWYFSAIVQANEKLQAQIQKGQTLRARAILSWSSPARHCKYRPVWGNQADFRIRLDP
jgi:hypothetical protein